MGSFIARQPNGLYCRFSTVVDCVTDYNMTEMDYIELCKEKAEREARDVLENYLQPFTMVEECFHPRNMARNRHEEILAEMKSPIGECEYKKA